MGSRTIHMLPSFRATELCTSQPALTTAILPTTTPGPCILFGFLKRFRRSKTVYLFIRLKLGCAVGRSQNVDILSIRAAEKFISESTFMCRSSQPQRICCGTVQLSEKSSSFQPITISIFFISSCDITGSVASQNL